MPRPSATPPARADEPGADASARATFVRTVTATDGAVDHHIGGKARSLARLAALGLPVPPAVAVSAAAFESLRSSGPPLPAALGSVAELAQLEAARAALLTAAAPPGFEDQLRTAVDDLASTTTTLPPTDGFAVRSSGATEDHAGVLAPGVFSSQVRVAAPAVAAAVRQVLASYLEPAAWMYASAAGEGAAVGGVLIHPFVVGTSFGSCACDATASGGEGKVLVVPSPEAPAPPTAAARAQLERAARLATDAHGPSELEWVSDGDRVLFLQLRPYRAPVAITDEATSASSTAVSTASWDAAAGWTWDAAHNPAPLSPAQAGLVQLVDARCRIGIRQRVFGGYLHYRAAAEAAPPPTSDGGDDPRAVFEHVRAAVDRRLAALPGDAALGAVLEAYVDGYQALYGQVGPALSRARQALLAFLQGRVPRPAAAAAELLAGVPSIAVERRAAARAIATAAHARARQTAIDAYLRRFGDESGSWDVMEPTFAEDPRRLVLLGATASAGEQRDIVPSQPPDLPRLSSDETTRFQAILATSRAAVAVGEDDDALFAHLQAAVRRALLHLGRQLVARGALDDPADIFFVPLDLSTTLDAAPTPPDLRATVAANRDAWTTARRAPPRALTPSGTTPGIIRGLAGAPGRVVGRAVHHPASTPLTADSILIASTLLPTELPLLSPAALVVETGTVLGHVAAQARERNLPAVVSAPQARTIPEGSLILVDGHRGEVLILTPP